MKKPIIKWKGRIEGKKMTLNREEDFKKYIYTLQGDIELIVKKKSFRRTSGQADEQSNQNGYYWAVLIPMIAEHFEFTPDEAHEALKYKFLRIGGTDEFPKIGSTAKLDKIQWEDLMEAMRAWALIEYSINIPCPNEY